MSPLTIEISEMLTGEDHSKPDRIEYMRLQCRLALAVTMHKQIVSLLLRLTGDGNYGRLVTDHSLVMVMAKYLWLALLRRIVSLVSWAAGSCRPCAIGPGKDFRAGQCVTIVGREAAEIRLTEPRFAHLSY